MPETRVQREKEQGKYNPHSPPIDWHLLDLNRKPVVQETWENVAERGQSQPLRTWNQIEGRTWIWVGWGHKQKTISTCNIALMECIIKPCIGTSLLAQLAYNLPAVQETPVRFLGWEDPLEKGMATHSSTVAWRISWTVYNPRGRKESDKTERLSLSHSVKPWQEINSLEHRYRSFSIWNICSKGCQNYETWVISGRKFRVIKLCFRTPMCAMHYLPKNGSH